MSWTRKILLLLLLGFGVLQFFRPAVNKAATPNPGDIAAHHPVPENVQAILHRACYDCHSDNTRYPWYAQVQPVGWWLANHIKEGKRHLNFSEFAGYEAKRATKKLKQTADQVSEHDMPLASYTLIHRDAKLSEEEAKLVADWATGLAGEINPVKKHE